MKLTSVLAAAAVAVASLSSLQGPADAVVIHAYLQDTQQHLRRRHHILHSKAVSAHAEGPETPDEDASSSLGPTADVEAEDSGSWDSQDVVETMRPKVHHVNWGQSNAAGKAASSSGSSDSSGSVAVVGPMDLVPAADEQYLPDPASVAYVANPSQSFGLHDAKTAMLLVSAVGAVAGIVIALVVAVLLRRQNQSESGFGPVELASNLPDLETATASAAVEQQDDCKLEDELRQEDEQDDAQDEEATFTNTSWVASTP